jgi:hypothetical protein
VAVSTRTEKPAGGGGLSVTTLVIASVSSVAAAYVIHTFWTGGAILGAGLTPIIVAIVSESLKRPTRAITAIREERRTRSTVAQEAPGGTPTAPPPELERPDPFGIWEADRPSRFHQVRGRPLKVAIATGVLAFVIAVFVVTSADLVFGGGNGNGDRLRLVPGTQERKATDDEDTKTTTQPVETTETTPEEVPPVQTAPETVPTTPPTTPAPTTTTPAPAPTTEQPAPAPTPEQPAPAPAPQG